MSIFFNLFCRNYYTRIFPDYLVELKKAVGNCESILDIGCGKGSMLKYFPKEIYSEGVDAFEPYIEESKNHGIHNKYYKMNVLDIERYFKENSFDCTYAGDVIEHLEKGDGLRLISMMEKIARKIVIIYTPNGFLSIGERDNNPLYEHKSGWEVVEMKNMGFNVIGMSGWKVLRGNDVGIKFYPKFFWRIISDITQFYTKNHPMLAKQLLCIKKL